MDADTKRMSVRLAGAALVVTLMTMPFAATSAQSPDAGVQSPDAGMQTPAVDAIGEVIGRFTAHLRGTQTEHRSTLLNVTYSAPGGACKPGLQSYSTDQTMSFESDPVEVEAVRLVPGTEGWDGQPYLLVAQGMDPTLLADMVSYDPPTGEMYDTPILFDLPVAVNGNKTNADPATGEGPAEPQPFEVACTGGDGVARSSPPTDCGDRTFTSDMAITQSQLNVAVPVSGGEIDLEPIEALYVNCPGSVDEVPGGFAWGEGSPTTYVGGSLPTVDQVVDPSLGTLDIRGQVTARYEETGYVDSQALDWKLTLCREGATAPNC